MHLHTKYFRIAAVTGLTLNIFFPQIVQAQEQTPSPTIMQTATLTDTSHIPGPKSMTVTFGSTPEIGDVLIAAVSSNTQGSPALVTPPAGWNTILNIDNERDDNNLDIADHIVNASDTVSNTFSIAIDPIVDCNNILLLDIRGANTVMPIESVTAFNLSTTPSVNTARPNTLPLAFFVNWDRSASTIVTSGWTTLARQTTNWVPMTSAYGPVAAAPGTVEQAAVTWENTNPKLSALLLVAGK